MPKDAFVSFKLQRISRVWYYGHARDDLWLSLEYDSAHEAIEPAPEAVVRLSDINTLRAFNFVRQDRRRPHRFFGCNTLAFARAWTAHLKVYTEGCHNDVRFKRIYDNGGLPTLIEWHFAEKEAADFVRELFQKAGFEEIRVIHTPPAF